LQAMLLSEQGPVEGAPLKLSEVPDPQPGPDELVIEVDACAVCRTDLHVIEGDLPPHRLPLVPGHEVVGTVAQLGSEEIGFEVGETVCLPWLYWTCGVCHYCLRGQGNLCASALFTGWDVDGGYAQKIVSRAAFTHRLPAGTSAQSAAPLLCAGVIGYRALKLAGAQRAARVGLYGFGASGHIAIQLARHWGAEVYVFTRTAGHQALAEELGAAWVGRAEDTPPHPPDCSVIFAPAGALVPEALRVLDKGGTVACAGIHMSAIPTMPYELLYHERTLCSVANSTLEDVGELLSLAAQIGIETEVSLFPLAEANRALQIVKDSTISGAAVLLPR